MKSVTIYTGPLCNFCDAAKRLLTRNNVEYKEINIASVDGAMDEMITKAFVIISSIAPSTDAMLISLYSTLFLVNNLFAASQKLQRGPV